jgi:hypothetical protein
MGNSNKNFISLKISIVNNFSIFFELINASFIIWNFFFSLSVFSLFSSFAYFDKEKVEFNKNL